MKWRRCLVFTEECGGGERHGCGRPAFGKWEQSLTRDRYVGCVTRNTGVVAANGSVCVGWEGSAWPLHSALQPGRRSDGCSHQGSGLRSVCDGIANESLVGRGLKRCNMRSRPHQQGGEAWCVCVRARTHASILKGAHCGGWGGGR